jgi:hypothetical protein
VLDLLIRHVLDLLIGYVAYSFPLSTVAYDHLLLVIMFVFFLSALNARLLDFASLAQY